MRLKIINYKLCVKYVPGRYLYLADTLSKAFITNMHQQFTDCYGITTKSDFTLT